MSLQGKRVWAVVPMKSFVRGKSRLRGELGDAHSGELARDMFLHVLSVTRSVVELAGTLVVTDGADVEAVSRAHGADVLRDPHGHGGLATAADAALAALEARACDAALVLMADLPRVTRADLAAILREAAHADVLVVPDTSGAFTNALLTPLSRGYTTCFGSAGSALRHLQRAEVLGLRAKLVHNENVAFDVDTPAELDASTGRA